MPGHHPYLIFVAEVLRAEADAVRIKKVSIQRAATMRERTLAPHENIKRKVSQRQVREVAKKLSFFNCPATVIHYTICPRSPILIGKLLYKMGKEGHTLYDVTLRKINISMVLILIRYNALNISENYTWIVKSLT